MQGRAGEVGRSIVAMADQEPVRVEDLYSEDAMLERLAALTGQPVANRDAFVTFANKKSAVVTQLLDDWVIGSCAKWPIISSKQQHHKYFLFIRAL